MKNFECYSGHKHQSLAGMKFCIKKMVWKEAGIEISKLKDIIGKEGDMLNEIMLLHERIAELEAKLEIKSKPFKEGCDCAECQPARQEIATLQSRITELDGALKQLKSVIDIVESTGRTNAGDALYADLGAAGQLIIHEVMKDQDANNQN